MRPLVVPVRLLCVCEGNIARSPVAALLLQEALGAAAEVTSAGTRAVVGAPVAPGMRELLAARSPEPVPVGGSFARQLRADHLRTADLVLTMTVRQRGDAVRLAPAGVRRTFTLRELARLLHGVDPLALAPGPLAGRLQELVPLAAARRRFVLDPGVDDIADPYGAEESAYRRAFDEVAEAVAQIAGVLVPAGRPAVRHR